MNYHVSIPPTSLAPAHSIAEKFNVQITDEVEKSISTPTTNNLTAYDLYLQALANTRRETGYGIGTYTGTGRKAISLLNRSLQHDPNYTQAMALLATNYLNVGSRMLGDEATTLLDSAVFLAKEAIIHDPTEVAGYLALGVIESGIARTFEEEKNALKWFHKAYQIDPLNSLVRLGDAYRRLGDYPEAVKYFSEKIARDPHNYLGYVYKAQAYINLGQPDSVEKYVSISEKLAPNSNEANMSRLWFHQLRGEPELMEPYANAYFGQDTLGFNKTMGIAYMFQRDWVTAEKYYRKTNYRDMDWGLVLIHNGRPDSGRIALENALAFRDQMVQPWTADYARIDAVLGNHEKALLYTIKVIEEIGISYDYMKNDPFIDEIRHLPKFKEIETEYYKINQEMLQEIKDNGY